MGARLTLAGALFLRVVNASCELERFDRTGAGELREYEQLAIDANSCGLQFRQELARAIFLAGNSAMRSSRAFDNCFENSDGDKVVHFLVNRARVDDELEAAIARDFGGIFPAKWHATAERVAGEEKAAQLLELRAKAPLRSKGKPVADAAHLPLFVAAAEPRLF